jgi:acyl-CoA synthetase (AMP-forming)/AMP-acid ligase II
MQIFDALIARAESQPDGVFCHFLKNGEYRRVSNAEIIAAARLVAARLYAIAAPPGRVVPIVLEHRVELYACFIGCVMAGVVPTFLPPLTRKQDPAVFRASMSALLGRIDPFCVIGSAATLPTIGAGGRPLVDLDAPAPPPEIPPLASAIRGDETAFLQHSSGTTGLKKGVMLSHDVVLRQIRLYTAAVGARSDDIVASWLPLYHDMGLLTSFLMPAATGMPIVSLDALEWVLQPTMLLDCIERFGATLCWLPNFAFHHIPRLAEPDRQWDLGSLRLLVNCSEPCRSQAFDAFRARFAGSGIAPETLQVSYAMAENVFAVTQTVPGRVVRRSPHPRYAAFLSSGTPLPATSLRITDEAGGEVSGQDIGEIRIRSECLFDGYFRQPELTAQRLSGGWYATGDLGFIDRGELFVVGRKDDVLNINGRKILAHEVEDDLNALAGLAPGRILAYSHFDSDDGANKLIIAAERPAPTAEADGILAAAIRRAVLASCGLSAHRVILLEHGFLLKSTSGKISRQASIDKIEELYGSR